MGPRRLSAAALTLVLATLVSGCGQINPSSTPGPLPDAGASRGAECVLLGGWDCTWQARFDRAADLVMNSPGQLGVELRDRHTDAVWRAGAADKTTWTASTIKLAMATYLFELEAIGQATLSAANRQDIADMFAWSSDAAADRIWWQFGGRDMIAAFQDRYGMTGLYATPGSALYWGSMNCGPTDLANLMTYVLEVLNTTDRAYIVHAMRNVDEIQHWGVWAVGSRLQAGTKNGWAEADEGGLEHWVTSTVGFVGPEERYVLAIMYSMPPGGSSLALGVHTVSDIAATLFDIPTPVPVVVRPT